MKTLEKLRSEYSGPHTKSGWPAGRFPHRVGDIHRAYADGLTRSIRRHIPDGSEIQCAELHGTEYMSIFIVGRLGINEYSALRMFVEGYKSAIA